MADRRARVDPECRHEQVGGSLEVRGREAEQPSALVAHDDDSLDLRRPAEQVGRMADVAGREQLPDVARRDAVDERHAAHVEAELLEEHEVARPAAAEAEAVSGGDDLGPDPAEDRLSERLRLERGKRGVEATFERREQLDRRAEERARVWIERHDRRAQVRRAGRLEDAAVAAMDPVEGADRDRARRPLELVGAARDRHPLAAETRASTSASARSSPGSNASGPTASAIVNGPTSVRLSVRQCPPSAVARART